MTRASTKPQHSDSGALDDVEIVLVTYHSRRLVESLLAVLPAGLPVVLVDNASGADGLDEVIEARPGARYLDGGGVGFARAANLGARTSQSAYLVFVNPDAAPSAEVLRALVDDLRADPGLAAVAATTVTPEGRVELGVGGWEPNLRRTLVYATGLHGRFPEAGLYARPRPGQPVQVDWLTGACLAVPRQTFVSLGGFDERFFLYNEDMAYGRRLREAGYRLRLRTDLLVAHAGAGSGGDRSRMLQMRGASMHAYLTRYHSASSTALMRVALTAGALSRGLVKRVRGDKVAARNFAAYSKGLWQGAPDMA